MLFDWLLRHPARVGILGALIGIIALASGLHFHIGSWVVDGVWGYAGAAVSGAAVALILWYAMRKEYGWP